MLAHVLLLSRAEKARVAINCGSGGEAGDDDAGGRQEGENCEANRSEQTRMSAVEENGANGLRACVACSAGL